MKCDRNTETRNRTRGLKALIGAAFTREPPHSAEAAESTPVSPARLPEIGPNPFTQHRLDVWLGDLWPELIAGQPVGLMLLSLDDYAAYASFNGHAAGEFCLQAVARCIREQLRTKADRVARIGLSEFAVVLPDTPIDPCGDIGERLHLALHGLEIPNLTGTLRRILSISIGVASIADAQTDAPETLIRKARNALDTATTRGGDQVLIGHAVGQTVRA